MLHSISSHVLYCVLPSVSGVPVQHAYMRPLGVISMLISVDEERGSGLFKVGASFWARLCSRWVLAGMVSELAGGSRAGYNAMLRSVYTRPTGVNNMLSSEDNGRGTALLEMGGCRARMQAGAWAGRSTPCMQHGRAYTPYARMPSHAGASTS